MSKKLLLAGAFLALNAGVALAQTATVTIAPADEQKFETWVMTEKHADVAVPSGFTLAVGATVPQTVELYEIPSSVGVASVTKYRYVRLGGKIVLVDPSNRHVVRIIGG
jgi:hypothetical protein